MSAPLAQARVVKATLAARLARHPAVNGVGLARQGAGWAVKVNLVRPAPELDLPREIDGVAVRTDVVGPIAPR